MRVNALLVAVAVCLLANGIVRAEPANAEADESKHPYEAEAREVTGYLQKTFFDADHGWYVRSPTDRKPDYVWRQAAAFSVLVGAARHDPKEYRPAMEKFFHVLDAFWDTKVKIPAYEPAPTRGNGNDKYYDDNEWLAITFLEAYELTGERKYLDRAKEVVAFVASGWDDQLGGGIWWHQTHKDGTKNTCANGPAAVAYLKLARALPPKEAEHWVEAARKVVDWTREKLQADDGLFDDRIVVATGEVKRGKLTYNSALMLRAELGLYRQTGRAEYLADAQRIEKAADWFNNARTGAYRDPLRYSSFMVEADIDLYRTTGDEAALRRAKTNADVYYAAWEKEKPTEMMSTACLARVLWLLADTETDAGRAFWKKADGEVRPSAKP